MFGFLALFAFFPAHLVAGQECTFGDVQFLRDSDFDDPIKGNPPNIHRTLSQNAHSSDDCAHFTADLGYVGRTCIACGIEGSHKEFQGGFVARAASETAFGRELVVARADLLDVGFLDDDGNRVEEKTMDWTLFPELDCTCDGETIEAAKGSCPSAPICSTSAPTEYGSLSVTQTSSIVGNIASLQVNVSIGHETLEGTPFFVVAVPPRFETSEEENGSIVLEKGEVRIVFDAKCGENDVSLVSIESTEKPNDFDFIMGREVFPQHNRVLFNLDGANATCDWSYAIEVELEESSAAGIQVAASTFLVALVAALVM